MKQAVVFLRGVKAGILTEDENGYTFEYDADYLVSADYEAVPDYPMPGISASAGIKCTF